MTKNETKDFFNRTTFLRPPTAGEPLYEDWARMNSNQRALLATDGSMTLLLGGLYNEAITVQTLDQGTQHTVETDLELQLTVNEALLMRTVLLKTAETQRTVAYAESSIVMNRLPNGPRRDLEDGDRAIGLILRDYNIPTIRHLESWGRASAEHPALSYFEESEVDGDKNRPLFYRSYSIAANIPGVGDDATVPVMRVAEYFPLNLTSSKELIVV